MRRRLTGFAATCALFLGVTGVLRVDAQSGTPAAPAEPFATWLAKLIDEAGDRGFSEELVAQTLYGLEPLPRVIQADRSQAELNPGLDRYLSTRVTRDVITRGRRMLRQHATVLSGVEREYEVQRRFVVAIWGMETRYGRIMGRTPVFRALATLAWEPRRAEFFRGELFNALTMVQRGYIDAKSMTGSWAGAMGHGQFMPSSYLKYAEDFDKDGRRDIWNVPDALASIANYLKGFGWRDDETWGREVRVSAAARDRVAAAVPMRTEGCYAIRNMTERRDLEDWAELGIVRADGRPLPAADIEGSLVTTGDKRTFLVYRNYEAILGYNCAHYYAIAIGRLADRLQ